MAENPLNFELNSSGISCERLDGEVVIISFETGKYFNSNNSAADIFYLVEKGINRNLWSSILASHFDGYDDEDSGVEEFLTMATDEKLFLLGGQAIDHLVDLPNDYSRKEWVKPSLLVFDDLADLLLIDPIHDTSTSGWPTQRNE